MTSPTKPSTFEELLNALEIAARKTSLDFVTDEGFRYDQRAARSAIVSAYKKMELTAEELDDLDSCIGDSLFQFERRSDDLDDEDVECVERYGALREKLALRRPISSKR